MAFSSKVNELAEWIVCLGEELGWYTAKTFQGYSIKKQETGWFLVIRVTDKNRAEVAYYGGGSIEDCFLQLAHDVRADAVKWRPDKYA